jgi:hypothetical protein
MMINPHPDPLREVNRDIEELGAIVLETPRKLEAGGYELIPVDKLLDSLSG